MRLSARQIELFQMAFRLRSTRKAAEALHISQPAVSRAVAEVEREIGVLLFDRAGRKFEPTPAAHSLNNAVQRHYHGLDRVVEAAQMIAAGTVGHLRIVALPAVADGLVVRSAGRLMARYPGLRFDVDVMGEQECLAALKSGGADCAVVSSDPGDADLFCQRVDEIQPMVALPLDDPLVGQASLSLAALVDRPLVMLPPVSPFRRSFEKLLSDAGLTFTLRAEARTQSALLGYVGQGAGRALVDPTAAAAARDDIVLVPLQIGLTWPIRALVPVSLIDAPAVRMFLDQMGADNNRPQKQSHRLS